MENANSKNQYLVLHNTQDKFKEFQFNGEDVEFLGPLKTVNIFIGANNSRKSRMMRKLLSLESYSFCKNPEISRVHSTIITYLNQILGELPEIDFKLFGYNSNIAHPLYAEEIRDTAGQGLLKLTNEVDNVLTLLNLQSIVGDLKSEFTRMKQGNESSKNTVIPYVQFLIFTIDLIIFFINCNPKQQRELRNIIFVHEKIIKNKTIISTLNDLLHKLETFLSIAELYLTIHFNVCWEPYVVSLTVSQYIPAGRSFICKGT